MRIGFIGPAETLDGELRQAAEFLLGDAAVDQVIYLGTGDVIQRLVETWIRELRMTQGTDEGFLDRAASLARHGTPTGIDELLEQDAEVQRLEAIHRLPDPPARAIEMLEGWIVLGIYDKALLDEEDIANAHVIVYGLADDANLRRFGPRYFFTPGALACGKVGVLELLADGQLQVSVYEYSGTPLWSQVLQGRAPLLVVTP